jgi:ankyrin repeat protein
LVVYRGLGFTLIEGQHRWRIPQEKVGELIELFRRADYFNLRGYYRIDASDLPTYITGLQIGQRRKFVLNYGRSMGEAVASTMMSDGGELAPLSAVEIEDAIDRVSGVDAWVTGADETLAVLRAQRWNFRSRQAGRAVAQLTIACNLTLAGGFIAEGAPVTVRIDGGWLNGQTAITAAPRCGDIAFVRELIRRGAVRNRAVAQSFLWASAASGRPGMVAEALRHSRAVNQQASDGETLLMAAVGALTPDEGDPRVGEYSIAATVGLLLSAGANARVRNDEGEGALHRVNNADAARALIQAGGDPKAQDSEGRTPLFEKYDGETVRVLIEAGADPSARDGDGQTPLFSAYNAEVVQALVAGGAEVGVQDARGRSPLDHAQNEGVAKALIGAGAQIPDDPTHLRNLISRARNLGWNEFLPVLLRHAEQRGLPSE